MCICYLFRILGETYERVKKPAEFAGLSFINPNTFYQIQRSLVIPTINKQFQENIEAAREESKRDIQVILGDGRFDSPGKSAKYCTYSCQCPHTNKIVATSTIQTTQGKGSSPLELKGFQNCLKELDEVNYNVNIVATDRNRSLAKWVRTERPLLKHKFDPWHFAKNIKTKLRPLSQRKGCSLLKEWIKPLANHLFWCADNSEDDPEKLRQMWQSVLFHIRNKHTFKTVHPKYPNCSHDPYSKSKARRTKWLEKDSPAYLALEKVVNDTRNLKDMEHLTKPYHTGSLEVFHSLINSYASKRQEFELNVMDARVKLAVLDHNNNVGRKQAVIRNERQGSGKKGEKCWKFLSLKSSKDWVMKAKMEPKSYAFIDKLMNEVVERKTNGEKITKTISNLERKQAPKNIASSERPAKSDIMAKYNLMKRFKK